MCAMRDGRWRRMWLLAVLTELLSLAAALGGSHAGCCGPSFEASGGELRMNGKPFKVQGISWFGFEGNTAVVDGLWARTIDEYLDFVAKHFNALRLPLALNHILSNPKPERHVLSTEPALQGKDMLGLLETVVERAARRNLLVLIDIHRLNASVWPDPKGLWYNDKFSFADLKTGWAQVAHRMCRHWNVFGADVFNEPHGATWGAGNLETDWDRAAEELGNGILRLCPRWLIFVEGVGQAGRDMPEYFWGENLRGVQRRPVALATPRKLVYSPHVYGPGLFAGMHYFEGSNFSRMPAVWHNHFGFLFDDPEATVVVGEYGGPMVRSDYDWQHALVDYFVRHGHVSTFYWALNPNSGDTGGVLRDDWESPTVEKIALLRPLKRSPIAPLLRGGDQFPCGAARGRDHDESTGDGQSSVPASVFRCTHGLGGGDTLCVTSAQRCNGVQECPDGSDERGCGYAPCVTIDGPDVHAECRIPFVYNGQTFQSCTRVDSIDGKPWCPTDLDARGRYSSLARSGACGPMCRLPRADEGPLNTGLCGGKRASSAGGHHGGHPGHCLTPPSPPPRPASAPLVAVGSGGLGLGLGSAAGSSRDSTPHAPSASTLGSPPSSRRSTSVFGILLLGLVGIVVAASVAAVGFYMLRRERGLAQLADDWAAFQAAAEAMSQNAWENASAAAASFPKVETFASLAVAAATEASRPKAGGMGGMGGMGVEGSDSEPSRPPLLGSPIDAQAGATRAAGAAAVGAEKAAEEEWWYLADDDKQTGPYSLDALAVLHADGVVNDQTLVWSEMLPGDQWAPFAQAVRPRLAPSRQDSAEKDPGPLQIL